MRAVLDTNVLVSIILGGVLSELIDYWDQGRFRVVVSPEILAEYATVLARRKFGLPGDTVTAILAYVQRKAELVTPTQTIHEIMYGRPER